MKIRTEEVDEFYNIYLTLQNVSVGTVYYKLVAGLENRNRMGIHFLWFRIWRERKNSNDLGSGSETMRKSTDNAPTIIKWVPVYTWEKKKT